MRRIRYQEIAHELRRRARAASPGSVLPSESELSAEFAASRVTVPLSSVHNG
jgi:GntR family transcriptional regulator